MILDHICHRSTLSRIFDKIDMKKIAHIVNPCTSKNLRTQHVHSKATSFRKTCETLFWQSIKNKISANRLGPITNIIFYINTAHSITCFTLTLTPKSNNQFKTSVAIYMYLLMCQIKSLTSSENIGFTSRESVSILTLTSESKIIAGQNYCWYLNTSGNQNVDMNYLHQNM